MKRLSIAAILVLLLAGCLAITGCGSGSKASGSGEQPAQQAAPTLGSTIQFDDLDITFGTELATTTIDNQFSDHNGDQIIVVPVTITNTGKDTKGLNMFAVKEYGPKGTELDTVFTYFNDDARMSGDMRSGATLNANLYFLYDGNGDYYLTFGYYKTDVEVVIPITL